MLCRSSFQRAGTFTLLLSALAVSDCSSGAIKNECDKDADCSVSGETCDPKDHTCKPKSCTPKTCSELGKECGGPYADGCETGGVVNCPACPAPKTCNGNTGICQAGCVPDCGLRECGFDPICGTEQCGACDPPAMCEVDTGMCAAACVPDCGARKCGLDPICGTKDCGTCTQAGEHCNQASGQCEAGPNCTQEPSIDNIRELAVKTNSASITWDTTVPGTCVIEYGTTTAYGSRSAEEDLAFFHVTGLTGLSEGTTYHYRVVSRSHCGIETASADRTFTTLTKAQLDQRIRSARADGGLPKVYYVKSSSGNDNNDGQSADAPWKTLEFAGSKVDAGDTVYLLTDTWTNDRFEFARSGIDVAPITLTAFPGDKPVLVGSGSDHCGYDCAAIDALDRSHLIIDGIEIKNHFNGINVADGSYNTVSNCYIHDTNSHALVLAGSQSLYNTLADNLIYNAGTPATTDNGIQISGIVAGEGSESQYITISRNTISHVWYHNTIDMYGSLRYVTIDGNDLFDGKDSLIANPHDDGDLQQFVTIKNNKLHDTFWHGIIACGESATWLVFDNAFSNINENYPVSIESTSHAFIVIGNRFNNVMEPPVRDFVGAPGSLYFGNLLDDQPWSP